MKRNATLDHARLLATAGVVLFHSGAPGGDIGYAGLPFFLILLVLFSSSKDRKFATFASLRFDRLMVPWLVWSLVYGALKLAEAFALHRPIGQIFAPWMVLTGPALHLWFLPFAFLASLVLWPLLRSHAALASPLRPVAALLAAALTVLIPLWIKPDGVPIPLPQWLFALPSLTLGLAFVLLPDARMRWGLMAALTGVAFLTGWPGGVMQTLIGGWLVLLCLALPRPGTRWSAVSAQLSLTVYLLHPLVISLLERIIASSKGSFFLAVTVLIVTIILSLLLQKMIKVTSQVTGSLRKAS